MAKNWGGLRFTVFGDAMKDDETEKGCCVVRETARGRRGLVAMRESVRFVAGSEVFKKCAFFFSCGPHFFHFFLYFRAANFKMRKVKFVV